MAQTSNNDVENPPKHDQSYVLVTPVRNEERFIGKTIKSVVNQTQKPAEWVIVSDGSTDGTNKIIEDAIESNPWIRILKLPPRSKPSWTAVVDNTTLGTKSLKFTDYSYIGLLDSDLEFQDNYFELLIEEFRKDSKLGLAGGVAIDIGRPKDQLPRNKIDVPGALQFFRRSCFETVGLVPIPEGGWDSVTCAMSRMNGYNTRLVTHLIVDHLKPRNTVHGGLLKRKWQMGVRDYALGYHPLFEIAKCASRLFREPPFILGSLAWFSGYTISTITRRKRVLPKETIQFTRSEQMDRLLGRKPLPQQS